MYSIAWLAVHSPARVITLQTSLSAAIEQSGPVKQRHKQNSTRRKVGKWNLIRLVLLCKQRKWSLHLLTVNDWKPQGTFPFHFHPLCLVILLARLCDNWEWLKGIHGLNFHLWWMCLNVSVCQYDARNSMPRHWPRLVHRHEWTGRNKTGRWRSLSLDNNFKIFRL